MKKNLSFVILTLFFIGCTQTSVQTVTENTDTYHEIAITLTSAVIDDLNPITQIDAEMERLQKEGTVFWYDKNTETDLRSPMYYLQGTMQCTSDSVVAGADATGPQCTVIDVQAYSNHLPPDYTVGPCNADGWCTITNPSFPEAIAKKFQNAPDFYGFDTDLYTVGRENNDDTYTIFKNDEEIFSHTMYFGAESTIEDASVVAGSPTFTFFDLIKWVDENHPMYRRNIFYKGETMNEKYGVGESSFLFSFKDKIGFIGEDNGKSYVFFNGQKVSADFDEIRTHGCCAISAYPIKMDADGTFFLLAKRGEQYFFAEIDLNKYL